MRDFQRYAKGFFLEDCRINVVFLYAGEESLASFGVIKVSLSPFFSFFAILHLRVLDCVGGADVVFAAAVPPCTTILFDVRVISRDRDEEVNLRTIKGFRLRFRINCSLDRYEVVNQTRIKG